MENNITTIKEYVAQFNPRIRTILKLLWNTIKENAPEATEKISWGMATFSLNGNLVHFSAQKNHIGFYPSFSAIEKFSDELSVYKTSKGAVQFPYDDPLPLDLISRMVKFRVEEQKELAKMKKTKKANKGE